VPEPKKIQENAMMPGEFNKGEGAKQQWAGEKLFAREGVFGHIYS
jgi:hypothetical protein